MLSSRSGHQVVHVKTSEPAIKNLLYVCGGRYPDETSKKTEFYDVGLKKWTEVGSLQ
jgi:predicted RNA-binding protein with PUA-like domain